MKKIFNNDIKTKISICAGNNDINGIKTILNNFIEGATEYKKGSNEYYITKFLSWLNNETDKLPFNVFKINWLIN